MKSFVFLLWFPVVLSLTLQADEADKPEDLDFYAFLNGVPAGSYKEQARFLKETGFDGISQVYASEGGEKLKDRVAAFKKTGVKVLSLYVSATAEPVKADLVEGLAQRDGMRGGMIELTVKKIDEEIIASIRKTAAMAEKLGIKVALYPHAGFAVATMPQAMEVIRKVGHPNLGVMFNLCHFLKSENEEDLEKMLVEAGEHLFAVSTCGADLKGENWSELIQTLDQGSFPQERLFKQLDKMGFAGPVGLQCYAIKGDKKENLKKSMKAWRELQARMGNQ